MNDKSEQRLTYSNKIEFKNWARKHGLTQKNDGEESKPIHEFDSMKDAEDFFTK